MEVGLYVHIPFCSSKCRYCDFDSGVFSQEVKERFLKALQSEVASAPALKADTVYFGGGTPSLLAPKELARALKGLRGRFCLLSGAELTLEANPETVSLKKARAWVEMGFNRISVGVQSFNDDDLKAMGRRHAARGSLEALDTLRKAGFMNLSIDLILGLPHQVPSKWEETLKLLFRLRPEHFSAYILDIHEGCAWARSGITDFLPKEDVTVRMYERMIELASVNGYTQYEISNFCLPGFESLHNLKYWSDGPYLGFGPSAHSYTLSERYWNIPGVLDYIRAIEAKGSARGGYVKVNPEDRRKEALIMGLRRTQGVDLKSFLFLYGWDILKEKANEIERCLKAGVLELSGSVLRLTPKSFTVSNEVFVNFL